jgi:hypothetical protein
MSPRIMRGFQQPSVRSQKGDLQIKFLTLSRHRRTKIAHAAHTTLVKAHQWGRGDAVSSELAGALERAVLGVLERKSKKKA